MSIQVTLSFASVGEMLAYFASAKTVIPTAPVVTPVATPAPVVEKAYAAAAEPLPNEEDEPFEEPANDNANPTAEDVAAALTKYGKTNGAVALKAVLDKFEAKRLSEIKPEDYAAVMAAVGA